MLGRHAKSFESTASRPPLRDRASNRPICASMLNASAAANARTLLINMNKDAFQKFVVKFLETQHGLDGFQDIRATRDGGSDGIIIAERRSIACYGPEQYDKNRFKRKLRDDYASYAANWRDSYPSWRVFINFKTPPWAIQAVDTLQSGSDIWGPDKILTAIGELPWHSQIKLYTALGVDPNLLGRDFLQTVVNDLADGKVTGNVEEYRKKAPDIEKKIRLNFADTDVQEATAWIEKIYEEQAAAQEILSLYETKELERIKLTVLRLFTELPRSLGFADRIFGVVTRILDRYNLNTQDAVAPFVHGLVFCLFVQCLLGSRPTEE